MRIVAADRNQRRAQPEPSDVAEAPPAPLEPRLQALENALGAFTARLDALQKTLKDDVAAAVQALNEKVGKLAVPRDASAPEEAREILRQQVFDDCRKQLEVTEKRIFANVEGVLNKFKNDMAEPASPAPTPPAAGADSPRRELPKSSAPVLPSLEPFEARREGLGKRLWNFLNKPAIE